MRKLALVIVFELVDAFFRPNDTTVPSRSPVHRFRTDKRMDADDADVNQCNLVSQNAA